MAKDFREGEDGYGNEKRGEERNDVVGQNKSLLWLNGTLLTRQLSSRRWELGRGNCGDW